MITFLLATLTILHANFLRCSAQSDYDGDFSFTNGPVPNPFQLHQRYPDRPETVECRPIRLQIPRGSRRFRTELVTNDHPSVQFANSDARIMSLRLRRHLNELAEAFHEERGVWITVSKAWVEGDAGDADPTSLHFEGRSVRVTVDVSLVSPLLQLAIEIGFDWVIYADENYVRMSVIPNLCDVSLDMVFMLDRSGSVGEGNFNIALSFLQDVVGFYDISSNSTQVGLVTYSTGATIEFDLDDNQSLEEVKQAISSVIYTKGWTATALALALARFMMDPLQDYGARPFEDGIPKVAVLLTDGRSNQLPITDRANALRDFGVQVYTVGIGDIHLPELKFIASDPDNQHVFLLNSFSSAQSFVDFLSITTCDAPAVVDPGEETRNEIEEDEFRFFESRCAAFSDTVMIEQIDLVGQCSLYASWSVQNPGPLDPVHTVVRNEDRTRNFRSLHLTLPSTGDRFVYVSVRGRHQQNEFSIVIWDRIFQQDEYTIPILNNDNTMGQMIINLVNEIRDETDAMFNFEIKSGNEEGHFSLDPASGILTAATTLSLGSFSLTIVAQNTQHSCHRAKVVVNVVIMEEALQFDPLPVPISISEATPLGDEIAQITATSSSNLPPTYSIIAGDPLNQFFIDSATGSLSVLNPLDFEQTDEYSLTIQARGSSSAVIMAMQDIQVEDANEPPEFVTECARMGSCMFSIAEGEPANVLVGIIEAADPDVRTPEFSTLMYRIEATDPVPFQISDMGEITTTETLDFETTPSFAFSISVRDSENPAIQTQVVVGVVDVDENDPPVFPSDCSLSIVENGVAVGEPVINCQASDDHLANEIVYEIVAGNTGGTFSVETAFGPGILVITRNLDREEVALYNLTLRATDPEGLSTTTMFQVTILDRNDSPPVCTPPDPLPTISSLPALGETVATFTAVDPDMDPAPPNFSITSMEISDDFLSATVTVRATDGEDPALFSSCSLVIQFQEICELQEYSIDSATGQLTASLLCNAMVDPPMEAIGVGRNQRFDCVVSANVPTLHQFLHNGTAITQLFTTSLVIRDVTFDNSGEYTCLVTNDDLGSILSSPAIVEIEIAPSIVTPPVDVEVMVAEPAMFQCSVFGVPEPVITWLGPDSENEVNGNDPRIQVSGGSLMILNVQLSDAGEYICRATNSRGSVSATATLTVFSMQQLVMAEVPQYSLQSRDASCHEFNSSHFNDVLTAITGHMTLTTQQDSNDLCPPSPCNPSPCENEGACVVVANDDDSTGRGFVCQCRPQFKGQTCGEVIDPCLKTPCRNGGLCASTSQGLFVCSCPSGYHGDRCQYTDVCLSSAPCRSNETCLETVVRMEGFVCLGGEEGEGVTVEQGDTSISTLDGEVNFYVETMEESRRRRAASPNEEMMENNGFVNICEGRFITSLTSSGTLRLVWACPEGVAPPGGDDEAAICVLLIQQRLVNKCSSIEGGTLVLQPITPLPPTRVNITFLLLRPTTGDPMTSSEVLVILDETQARDKLNDTIYRTERFTAVAASDGSSPQNTDERGVVIGAVLGTLAALIALAVVMVIAVTIIKGRRRGKIVTLENHYHQNGNGTRDLTTFSNHYTQVPRNENEPLKPATVPALQPPPVPSKRGSMFDDPVYDAGFTSSSSSSSSYHPPVTKKRSLERGMRTSLERGMKLIRGRVPSMRRSDSASGLLSPPTLEDSGDYDDIATMPVTTPRHVTTPSINGDPESGIYANTAHHRGGAMGNAGQRWESYQQTRTLLRTDPNTSK